jgi:hypothetical protein
MAFLPKDPIFVVLQALSSGNARRKYRPDWVGAVHLARLQTVRERILGQTRAPKMDGKIAMVTWGRKVGQELLKHLKGLFCRITLRVNTGRSEE